MVVLESSYNVISSYDDAVDESDWCRGAFMTPLSTRLLALASAGDHRSGKVAESSSVDLDGDTRATRTPFKISGDPVEGETS